VKRWFLLLAWAAALALWGWGLGRELKIASDLTLFMPEAHSEIERLLVRELRDGPGSRLVLVTLTDDSPEVLAAVSRRFAENLRDADSAKNPEERVFARVENGERIDDPALRALLTQYRYLLSPAVNTDRFTTDGLREALQERLLDLASPVEPFIQELLPRDPTGELLTILQDWRPVGAPHSYQGVWFSPDRQRALLLAETRAPGFDLDAQSIAVAQLQRAFALAAQGTQARLLATGPGPFAVAIQDRTRRDAQLFSIIDSIVLVLWLYFCFRSARLVLLAGLPLVSGVLAGMTAVLLLYGGIHGITLAFGTTLLGIALDYPVHVFSHRLPGGSVWQGLRHNWPTLWIGVLTVCIAYIALIVSDFSGLAQLGVFTVAGLLTAALCTRWLLPPLLPDAPFDIAASRVSRWQKKLDQQAPVFWLAPLLIALSLGWLWFSPHPVWQNDLSALSPVPRELQDADTQMRRDLGAADVRYLAVLRAPDREQALIRSEALRPRLDQLVETGALRGYDMAARYLPSHARQDERRAALPEAGVLAPRLALAMQGLPFQTGLFEPFLQDVEASRRLPVLEAKDLSAGFLGTRLATLLNEDDTGWVALMPLHDVKDPAQLRTALQAPAKSDVLFLDLKAESEQLVVNFRGEMLKLVGIAVVVMVLVMVLSLRRRQAVRLIVLPTAATVLSLMAVMNLLQIQLTLFHLVALMLVVGISIDYALYLSRDENDSLARARSLHSLLICCLSTAMGFGILALSEIPVLRAIGATVCGGVILGLVLGVLGARSSLNTGHST
jgi:predicted exporter